MNSPFSGSRSKRRTGRAGWAVAPKLEMLEDRFLPSLAPHFLRDICASARIRPSTEATQPTPVLGGLGHVNGLLMVSRTQKAAGCCLRPLTCRLHFGGIGHVISDAISTPSLFESAAPDDPAASSRAIGTSLVPQLRLRHQPRRFGRRGHRGLGDPRRAGNFGRQSVHRFIHCRATCDRQQDRGRELSSGRRRGPHNG